MSASEGLELCVKKDKIEDFFFCYYNNTRYLESLAPLFLALTHLRF